MKIVGIVGILDFSKGNDRLWGNFREAFLAHYPEAEFVVEHCLYLPWHKKRIQNFGDSILRKHDTEEEVMLFGYSLGGVIACAIAQKFKKARMRAVVTFGSPHRFRFFYRGLASPLSPLPIPVFTFAGAYDLAVLRFFSVYPGSIHTNLQTDHLLGLIFSKKPAIQIVDKTVYLLAQSNGVSTQGMFV